MVFYLGGADPYRGDRFGRLGLTIDGLERRDRLAFEHCRRLGVPLVLTMAGGYARELEDVITIQCNTVAAALRAYG